MIRFVLRVLLLLAAFLLMTIVVGWYGPALVGLLWGLLWRRQQGLRARQVIASAALGGALAAASLLVYTAVVGRLGAVAEILASVIHLPIPFVLMLPLASAALLASAGTWLGLTISAR